MLTIQTDDVTMIATSSSEQSSFWCNPANTGYVDTLVTEHLDVEQDETIQIYATTKLTQPPA